MLTRLGVSEKPGPLTWGTHREFQCLEQSSEERNYGEEIM